MVDRFPELEEFLEELSALSRRHGVIIGGCGHCGSPYLDGAGVSVNGLTWNAFYLRYEIFGEGAHGKTQARSHRREP